MRQLLLTLLLTISASSALACYSDHECGYGNRCAKSNPYGRGICVQSMGLSDGGTTYQPMQTCYDYSDCPYGKTCIKPLGQSVGICR